jgi:hypothetical protein
MSSLFVSLAADCEDRDGDGFEVTRNFITVTCATIPDVNDDDPLAYPGAPERCNGRDDDGDLLVDEDAGCDRTCDNAQLIEIAAELVGVEGEDTLGGDIAWADGVWVVAAVVDGPGVCGALDVFLLEPDGTIAAGPSRIAGGDGELARISGRPNVVWTGHSIGVGWQHNALEEGQSCDDTGISPIGFPAFQVLEPDLRTRGERFVAEECGFWSDPRESMSVGFNGRLFGIAWRSDAVQNYDDRVFFTVVTRDGVPRDGCGIPVAERDFAEPARKVGWNGQRFGVPVKAESDIFLARATEEGNGFGGLIPVSTSDELRSMNPAMAVMDGEWGLLWADERFSWSTEIFHARVGSDGTVQDPPGEVRVTTGNPSSAVGQARDFPDAEWTGEEILFVHDRDSVNGQITTAVVRRADVNGVLKGFPVTLGVTDAQDHRFPRLAWSGEEIGMVTHYDDRSVPKNRASFVRVGCNCTDDDRDFYTTCQGQDCDDGDPSINPAGTETCLSGADENCDGLIDCQDTARCPAGGGEVPGEVSGVAFAADRETLTWDARGDATSYDVLTGDVAELRASGSFDDAECGAWRLPDPSWVTSTSPLRGRGTWYLVRGKADTCLLGTWGSVARDEARLICP